MWVWPAASMRIRVIWGGGRAATVSRRDRGFELQHISFRGPTLIQRAGGQLEDGGRTVAPAAGTPRSEVSQELDDVQAVVEERHVNGLDHPERVDRPAGDQVEPFASPQPAPEQAGQPR